MPLKDIKEQPRAVEILLNGLKQERVAHAYLFLGPKGSRRLKTALEFAKLINCELEKDDCCATCASCSKIEKLIHPDIYLISREKGVSQISIKRIRELQKRLSLKAFEARYKVAIIAGAEAMTEEASNSLLKMLEEPNADTVFILIASSEKSLLDTIISRCQVIRFRPLTRNEVNDILIKDFSIDEKRAKFLSAISGADIEKALELKDEHAIKWKNNIIDEFSLYDKRLGQGESPDSKRDIQLDAMEVLLNFYRDILVYKFTHDEELIINIDRIDDISDFAKGLTIEKLQKNIESINEAKESLEANCNGKLVIRVLQEKLGDWSKSEVLV